MTDSKTLDVVDVEDLQKKVSDVVVVGDGNLFQLISKASSESQGWMKSTKAMEVTGVGVVVQVTTQQRNSDGSYAVAEALSFVPNAFIDKRDDGSVYISPIPKDER